MTQEFAIRKYPRTQHVQGSRLQPGDEDLSQTPFAEIAGRRVIVEEKVDGANTAISFDQQGELLLQSRGHYLTGGLREKHYALLKSWAQMHRKELFDVLGCRYIMYGEWLYAKHTVFYDALPHYFLEFDVYDRENGAFLDTPSRRNLLGGLPVASVPVLSDAPLDRLESLTALIGPSHFITDAHLARLQAYCEVNDLDAELACKETCSTILMEGLYIKVESNGRIQDRMKYVRHSFLQCVDQSGTHWLDRPIIPNQLCWPIEVLFEPKLPSITEEM